MVVEFPVCYMQAARRILRNKYVPDVLLSFMYNVYKSHTMVYERSTFYVRLIFFYSLDYVTRRTLILINQKQKFRYPQM